MLIMRRGSWMMSISVTTYRDFSNLQRIMVKWKCNQPVVGVDLLYMKLILGWRNPFGLALLIQSLITVPFSWILVMVREKKHG